MERNRILLLPIPAHPSSHPHILDILDFIIPFLDHEDELRKG
jgi:hypothetical protein